MPEDLSDKVRRWALCAQPDEPDFNLIDEQICHFAETRFNEYTPTTGPHPDFRTRLGDWLDQAAGETDQKIMFNLVPKLFFPNHADFLALCRAALRGPITQWLIDIMGIPLQDPSAKRQLDKGLRSTWFCPITDSMPISAFCHVNNLSGTDLRPEWRAMQSIEDAKALEDRILLYLRNNALKRIVLLEDFVGGGSQMEAAVSFAATLSDRYPVLVVPLIVCPAGVESGRRHELHAADLTFSPVVRIPSHALLSRNAKNGEPPYFAQLRELVERYHHQVVGNHGKHAYGPFGFSDTGALVVNYTNCPDNTIPIVHHASDTWRALFPRSSRI